MAHAMEKIRSISNQCMQDTLGSQQWDQTKVPVWVNAIDRNIMTRLKNEVSVGLKYNVSTIIVQKVGNVGVFHSSLSHGDPSFDGQVSATFENDTISCICLIYAVTVFPRSPEGSTIGSTIVDNSPRNSPPPTDAPPPVVDMSGSEGDGYAWFNPLSWFGSEVGATPVTQDHSPPPPPPSVIDVPYTTPHIAVAKPINTSTPRMPHSSEPPLQHMPAVSVVRPAPVVVSALPSLTPMSPSTPSVHSSVALPTATTTAVQGTRDIPRSAVMVPAAFAAALMNKQTNNVVPATPTTPPTTGKPKDTLITILTNSVRIHCIC